MQNQLWRPIQSRGTMWIKYEVDRYWPRRLLYIPDMTSYERVGDDEYNTTKCPPYSIISYTWGRWEVKGDERSPAIPIKGVTWPIPAIDETHFTAETFESVVRQMNRNGVEWAWLDVACIDQTPGSISKMDEIGHQAAIFQQASACYVWFSHLSFQELTHAISIIDASMLALSNNTSDVDLRSVNRVLSSLRQALHHIFNDPWFSSLWTLQELVLRPDAIVFTSTGQPVIRQTGHPFFMTGFINDCFNIYSLLDYFEDYFERTGDSGNLNDRILNHTTAIQDQIRRAGFQVSYTNNPNVPYAQAKYRQAQERNDRIYGIMQIYGLRVGETVRPNHKIHFEELLDELALAINNRSPILGQLYLHTTRPPAGKGWRITENSMVPWDLSDCRDLHSRSSITKNAGGLILVSGGMCSFDDFLQGQLLASRYGLDKVTARFYLDQRTKSEDLLASPSPVPYDSPIDSPLDDAFPAPEDSPCPYRQKDSEPRGLEYFLLDQRRLLRPYPVLISGDATYEAGEKIRAMNADTELTMLLLGHHRHEAIHQLSFGQYYYTQVALILAKSPKLVPQGSFQAFSRIGICTWHIHPTIAELEGEALRQQALGLYSGKNLLSELHKKLEKQGWDTDEALVYKFRAWSDKAFSTHVTIELE